MNEMEELIQNDGKSRGAILFSQGVSTGAHCFHQGMMHGAKMIMESDDPLETMRKISGTDANLIAELLEALKVARSAMAQKYNAKECAIIDAAISKAVSGTDLTKSDEKT